jgi:predicted TIM-barrel fold metal-dependent hydrolase
MTVVDIHPHVIASDVRRYPFAPLGGKQSDWSRERPVDAEQMLAAMDEAGIAKAVLVQASTCYGHDNSYVADAVAAHPKRFAGVFSVDMTAADAPQRIRHWLGRGLKGLRVFIAGHTTAHDARLDDPRSFPAWRCAVDAGIPSACSCARPPAAARGAAQEFPPRRIVLDHMARDDGTNLFSLARHPNLFLKFTTHNVRDAADPQAFMRKVVDAFGAKRIAWGSNYPASDGALSGLLAEARQAHRPCPPTTRIGSFADREDTVLTMKDSPSWRWLVVAVIGILAAMHSRLPRPRAARASRGSIESVVARRDIRPWNFKRTRKMADSIDEIMSSSSGKSHGVGRGVSWTARRSGGFHADGRMSVLGTDPEIRGATILPESATTDRPGRAWREGRAHEVRVFAGTCRSGI